MQALEQKHVHERKYAHMYVQRQRQLLRERSGVEEAPWMHNIGVQITTAQKLNKFIVAVWHL